MQLTVHNLTDDNIVSSTHDIIQPSSSSTFQVSQLNLDTGVGTLSLGAKKWNVVTRSPWRIYRCKISRRHHKLLIIPRRNLSSFLSEMPDTLPLSSLLLPGTHDTMAFYGWPISQCQLPSTPLSTQLHSGIRVLDIRLSVINSRLISYHGIYPERTPFSSILSTLYDFLSSPLTSAETVVVSIKQEDFARTPPSTFSLLVRSEMAAAPGGMGIWFLENRVPTLGEVRGKAVLFSRFGGDGEGWEGGREGMGIHPPIWPDSERAGFEWWCKDTLVRTHDWYAIPSFLSIPEKTTLATRILLPPSPPPSPTLSPGYSPVYLPPPNPTLSITFFSASSFPLAPPPTIARGFGWPKWGLGVEGVNSRVGRWLIDQLTSTSSSSSTSDGKDGFESGEDECLYTAEKEKGGDAAVVRGAVEPRIRGWALMDFYTDPAGEDGIVPLLVECNFRGRR